MKILTVNIPIKYIEIIDTLVGFEKNFPSRSELIRMAVREWLIAEIKHMKKEVVDPFPVIEADLPKGMKEMTIDGKTYQLKQLRVDQ